MMTMPLSFLLSLHVTLGSVIPVALESDVDEREGGAEGTLDRNLALTIVDACFDNPLQEINYELNGVSETKTCGDINDSRNDECLEEDTEIGDFVWQLCPARCVVQSLCPISVTCDNDPSLEVSWDIGPTELSLECSQIANSEFCGDIETKRSGYVWQHCQSECYRWSGCPEPSDPIDAVEDCSNSPDLEVTYNVSTDEGNTKTSSCRELSVYPRRCLSRLVGGGFVWEQCQRECFSQSGCPYRALCMNAPDSSVRIDSEGAGALQQCSELASLGLNSTCERSALDLVGPVYQFCQRECYLQSGCPGPTTSPSVAPSPFNISDMPTFSPLAENLSTAPTTLHSFLSTEEPSAIPTSSPSLGAPSSAAPSSEPSSTSSNTSSAPTSEVLIVDVTVVGIRLVVKNVGELSVKDIRDWEVIMEDWFLGYFRKEREQGGRRLDLCPDRRRDSRDICLTDIEFVKQEATEDENGVDSNEIVYDQRIVYSDGSDSHGNSSPLGDLSPAELAGLPFEDESYNIELAQDLQREIDSFSEVEYPLADPSVPSQTPSMTSSSATNFVFLPTTVAFFYVLNLGL